MHPLVAWEERSDRLASRPWTGHAASRPWTGHALWRDVCRGMAVSAATLHASVRWVILCPRAAASCVVVSARRNSAQGSSLGSLGSLGSQQQQQHHHHHHHPKAWDGCVRVPPLGRRRLFLGMPIWALRESSLPSPDRPANAHPFGRAWRRGCHAGWG
eukprot:COSAG06_NODE_20250_length_802_cov_17.628734_1_plen_158_part_00